MSIYCKLCKEFVMIHTIIYPCERMVCSSCLKESRRKAKYESAPWFCPSKNCDHTITKYRTYTCPSEGEVKDVRVRCARRLQARNDPQEKIDPEPDSTVPIAVPIKCRICRFDNSPLLILSLPCKHAACEDCVSYFSRRRLADNKSANICPICRCPSQFQPL